MTNTDIYNYLYPIISGCGGFIKSDGYVMVRCNTVVLMTYDRAFLSVIPINPINLVYIALIKDFVNAKNDPENFITNTHFNGNMLVYYEMESKYELYTNTIQDNIMEYHEDDIYNIPKFEDHMKVSGFHWTSFGVNGVCYKLMVSKSIFPINKGDTCSVSIFNMHNDNTRILKYRIYKKKLKVYTDIYTRQFVFYK